MWGSNRYRYLTRFNPDISPRGLPILAARAPPESAIGWSDCIRDAPAALGISLRHK